MTADEGRALPRGTVVYFATDPRDRGTVLDNNGEVVRIQWGRDKAPSLHLVTNLARVHRWQRGLRGLSRQDAAAIAREAR
jgi:hypothetical protein